MVKRLFISDLDRTIFDCDRFYIDICKQLQKKDILSNQQLSEITLLLQDLLTNPYLSDLITRYRLEEAVVAAVVQNLTPNKYVYPDVKGWLQNIKPAELIILTTGIAKYQEMKFQVSPMLAPYPHRVIKQPNKGSYLLKRLKYSNVGLKIIGLADEKWYQQLVLIDDRNYNLNALASSARVKLFHIRRPTEKMRDLDIAPAVSDISSFKEVA